MSFDQDQFRAIVSGRRRDARARIARALLRAAALGYRLAVCVRNWLYECRLLRVRQVGVPVLCVGNLTAGGTGKTPLVIFLARRLSQKGLRVAILTRGYLHPLVQQPDRLFEHEEHRRTRRSSLVSGRSCCGVRRATSDESRATRDERRSRRPDETRAPCPVARDSDHEFDEPAEILSACPDVPVVVNPDRIAAAVEAIGRHSAQVLLMDDGFQHRRLARDLDIVTIDATAPFGYGRLLPAGLLREPVGGLRRADTVVLTRCDLVSECVLAQIEADVLQVNPDLTVARSVHAPVAWHSPDGLGRHPDQLRSKKVFAFCGLGNPGSFLQTVASCGCEVVGSRTFNDHHAYTDRDLAEVHSQARSDGAEWLLTSQKDWTKISRLALPEDAPQAAYLAVELRFTAGGESLTTLIDACLAGTIPSRR